ncbi:MAG: P1 family peptidase [Alphaproteobacteria bacterium]|nr:P1 family peptidase [Alphaproteobacteria bacterium]
MSNPHLATPSGKARARALLIPLLGEPGPANAITDVPGVEVGYTTLIAGDGPLVVGQGPVRTGVTAILPRGRADLVTPCFAGYHSLNGNGELTGTIWIEEAGQLGSPITITNTHSCGVTRDATLRWMVNHHPSFIDVWGLPVAGETYDGLLNDINGFHVRDEHVFAALDGARGGPIEEGSVGGGTGMICYEFKGGSGTASRRLRASGGNYTVGAFVQANFGMRHQLTIAGVPIGVHIPEETVRWQDDTGSIIAVVATDAPLLPHQLKRLARRIGLGVGRSGAVSGHGSGDIFLAFATGNAAALRANEGQAALAMVPEGRIGPFFDAVIQAVDEAILNAMVANETMVGRDGNTVLALPHDRVKDLLRRYGRLA